MTHATPRARAMTDSIDAHVVPHRGRVLHLYNVFGASTERFSFDTTFALEKRGFATLIGYETISDECPAIQFRATRLTRIRVEPTDNIDAQMRRIAVRPEDPALAALVDRPFDLIHGHFGTRVLHAAPFLYRGLPAVISVHGYDASRLLLDRCWIERYRWAADHGATFVTVSDASRDHLVALGLPEARVTTIRVGIDPMIWPYVEGPAPSPPHFLFVGRLTPKKAPADLIAALVQLRAQHGLEATATLIGGGPLETDVRELIEQHDLADHVKLIGHVRREFLPDMYHGATAFVLPCATADDGDREGMPRVLLEAQACGLPVITTRHSGNAETLPPEAQRWVVEEHDTDALARAMHAVAQLDDDERLATQQRGRAWVESHFRTDQTIDAYDVLYEALIERH